MFPSHDIELSSQVSRQRVFESLNFSFYPANLHYYASKVLEKSVEAPYRDWETDRKSTRLNSSHSRASRMPSSA